MILGFKTPRVELIDCMSCPRAESNLSSSSAIIYLRKWQSKFKFKPSFYTEFKNELDQLPSDELLRVAAKVSPELK
jgi:hypothetical protein